MTRSRRQGRARPVAVGHDAFPTATDRTQVPTFLRHVIVDISYRNERIVCACGAIITAPHDTALFDAHMPLVEAWNRHRAENLAHRKPRVPPGLEHVWNREGDAIFGEKSATGS